MNPDIQRIAEKWDKQALTDGYCSNRLYMEKALTELSALRDTQDRELREKLEQTENMATEDVAYQNTHIIQKDQLITSLRAELARRDEVEKELRKENEISKTLLSAGAEELKDHVELLKELASLRSRIGELEDRKS